MTAQMLVQIPLLAAAGWLLSCAVPARVLAWHLQVRCINFPADGLDDEPGPVTLSPTGEP